MHSYLRQAMFRGEFMCANARNECRGIPFDPIFHQVIEHWDRIREQLVVNINADYHVYEGDEFREHLFEQYLERERLTWPRLESGRLDLKEKTFRDMAKLDVRLAPLHELRATLSQLREIKIKVDADWRVRTNAVGIRIQDRPHATVRHRISVWSGDMGTVFHQAAAGPRPCLLRFRAGGIRDCCSSEWRRSDACGLQLG